MDSIAPPAKKLKLSTDDENSSVADKPSAESAFVERFFANCDVWQRIFYFLDMKARIRLEMVNKRLQCMLSELWEHEKTLELNAVRVLSCGDQQRRAEAFDGIFTRVGVGLRSLTIGDNLKLNWATDLRSVSEHCPNVESIEFIVETLVGSYYLVPVDVRFDSFSKLKSLRFGVPQRNFVRAPISVFLSIPCTIEILCGLSTRAAAFETAEQLELFFAERPFFKQVQLEFLFVRDGTNAKIFPVIATSCPQLKRLRLLCFCDVALDGVELLSGMVELKFGLPTSLTDDQLIEICERNPGLEILSLDWALTSSLSRRGFDAVAKLTKLRELNVGRGKETLLTVAQLSNVVRELARNSGASLVRLELGCCSHHVSIYCDGWYLSQAAISEMAMYCTKLRRVQFGVLSGDVEPQAFRHFIDCVVADPSWNPAEEFRVDVAVKCDTPAAFAPLEQLEAPAAHLPVGVRLNIHCTTL